MAHGACDSCGNAVEECTCERMSFTKLVNTMLLKDEVNWSKAPRGALDARKVALWNMLPAKKFNASVFFGPIDGVLPSLPVGTLVTAMQRLDPSGANAPKGMDGMVVAESQITRDGVAHGPLVQWLKTDRAGVLQYAGICNVYPGQVRARARARDADLMLAFVSERPFSSERH